MLKNRKVLIVEDEYVVAQHLADALEDEGAEVVGPARSIEDAIALIAGTSDLDGALLDVNLAGEMSYPVAYDLSRRAIPFVFLTAYDPSLVAARFKDVPHFAKPVEIAQVLRALSDTMATPEPRAKTSG